ncbi:hybrid sensor histidine kinase/response regulator [Aestuariirhabdus sp. Z084]|uniref:ATP-binding response regulator n=1 Tax=Aestuariirhabdus haliotis TaxID=2918751 RepID=UPI00201B401E|nr:hybrid sensor histidine kinase/response regulator [Aestuariirhabdus haliotis]MCL6417214.1 hybrid sensor histidine kinase/response regulator [Aestuariirhabdus haliotis]MCL6421186.1 hybrid sensor histidine kinase/response regulator [Aestuariirhabdus haliotis]
MSTDKPSSMESPHTKKRQQSLQQQLEQVMVENARLKIINKALIERVEAGPSLHQGAYGNFEHAVFLAEQVREQTDALTTVNEQLRQEIGERKIIQHHLLEAKKEAEQANHSKTKFLAATSHDLLQPMNAARLFAASLLEHPLRAKTQALVQSLNYSLLDVETLLAALVDISKLDAGAIQPDINNFCANDLLRNLANEFRTQAAQSQLHFHWVPSTAIIATDCQLLARILRNFLSNAIRYTDSGRIVMGCRRTRQGLLIQVWDTGSGIEVEQQQAIFEEFNRLSPDHSAQDRGLGLGLAIVDKIATMLGHEISVHSTPGVGSCFSVRIPYGELPQTNSDVSSAPIASINGTNEHHQTSDSRPQQILVIDNEPSICQAMKLLLEGWGFTVITGHNFNELIAQLKPATEIDLIIADYHLDEGDTGLRVIDKLSQEYGIQAPVLIITANYSNELKQQVRALKYQLMTKPVRPAKLKVTIRHLLDSAVEEGL